MTYDAVKRDEDRYVSTRLLQTAGPPVISDVHNTIGVASLTESSCPARSGQFIKIFRMCFCCEKYLLNLQS